MVPRRTSTHPHGHGHARSPSPTSNRLSTSPSVPRLFRGLTNTSLLSRSPRLLILFLGLLFAFYFAGSLATPSDSALIVPRPRTASALADKVVLSVVVPAYHEHDNLKVLLPLLKKHMPPASEVIVVDDNSADGTIELMKEHQQKGEEVLLIVRKHDSGLSSAVVRGIQESRGDTIVVMDADLQHPPETVPRLLRALDEQAGALMALARREKVSKDWPFYRRVISAGAHSLARPLTSVSDPMTGFFALRRQVVCLTSLSGKSHTERAEV